jgi:hypothetical protein
VQQTAVRELRMPNILVGWLDSLGGFLRARPERFLAKCNSPPFTGIVHALSLCNSDPQTRKHIVIEQEQEPN